jgi:predicted acetyltransferase
MNLEIVSADDAYETVSNLARFYIYDMAEHAGFPFAANGDFVVGDQFNPWWGRERPSRPWPAEWKGSAFLARVDGNPAGFALVTRQSEKPVTYDMGEFFVARQYRRQKVGDRLATAMFDRFAGQWVVREMLSNVNAQAFWRRIIADYTGGKFTDAKEKFPQYGGRDFIVQRFESGANA